VPLGYLLILLNEVACSLNANILIIQIMPKQIDPALKVAILEGLQIACVQRQTIDEYNQELEESDAAIDRGEFITNDQLMDWFIRHK
jgi:hypothetical protein